MPQAKTDTGAAKKASTRAPRKGAPRKVGAKSPRAKKRVEAPAPAPEPPLVPVADAPTAPIAVSAPPARKKKATKPKAATPRLRPKKAIDPPLAAPPEPAAPATTPEAPEESVIAAAKFRATPRVPAKRPIKPTLPSSYGESRLLLLARDPQTLFAAWDIAPGVVDALKTRIGARAFAVSPFTLRLTRPGGSTSVIHVGRKARSRYIRIDSGPSFTAEIGFTTPAGSFESIAKSPACFVPMGPARQSAASEVKRTTLSYREARSTKRREALRAAAGRVRSALREDAEVARGAMTSGSRILGGASDLYRR